MSNSSAALSAVSANTIVTTTAAPSCLRPFANSSHNNTSNSSRSPLSDPLSCQVACQQDQHYSSRRNRSPAQSLHADTSLKRLKLSSTLAAEHTASATEAQYLTDQEKHSVELPTNTVGCTQQHQSPTSPMDTANNNNNQHNNTGPCAAQNSDLSAPPGGIDESLYSRQLYVLGRDAMQRLARKSVLVCGLRGAGLEVAKNVILAGVRRVSLYDPRPLQARDLGAHFLLHAGALGQPRDCASMPALAALNPYVSTDVLTVAPGSGDLVQCAGGFASTYTRALTAAHVAQYSVLVLCDTALCEQRRLAAVCRQTGVCLIVCDSCGLLAQVFCDFGAHFTVLEADNAAPLTAQLVDVSRDEVGVVTCLDEQRHGLCDGDCVTFAEVRGMVELNGCEPRAVKVLGPYTFSIGSTAHLSPYVSSGIVKQVKQPTTLHFAPLEDSIDAPQFVCTDFGKLDRCPHYHLAYRALHEYCASGAQPGGQAELDIWQEGARIDVERYMHIARALDAAGAVPAEALLRAFAATCRGELCAVNSCVGAIAAQEVMKACTAKFTPIQQWLYLETFECVADRLDVVPARVAAATSSGASEEGRYQAQLCVFGADVQRRLADMSLFVVGAGAIGCELLKNLAMMGVATGNGKITITDMDLIEKSNLNRQFLFRQEHVGQSKSARAADATRTMNSAVRIEHKLDKVCADTEHVFDDEFFHGLSAVFNALDNVTSRVYMDRRCVYYRLPLFDSGTMGTMGNVQCILPHVTESYSSSQDPPEKDIPICTLKNFPNAIEHTIQWARDLFEGEFRINVESAASYLRDPVACLEGVQRLPGVQPVETLATIRRCLVGERPTSIADCVAWARNLFETHFHNQIVQLLYNFPPDQLTSSGALFWSAPKRCPTPIKFDAANHTHLDFVVAASNLRACAYGLPACTDRATIARCVQHVTVAPFVPQSGVRIATTDTEAESMSAGQTMSAGAYEVDDDTQMERIRRELAAATADCRQPCALTPIEFEKDCDDNHHIDFVTACSNLRATNYGIGTADRSETKRIAGRIIPAIATTTALVSGLVCLELYKLARAARDIAVYRNCFVNLALPFVAGTEPIACARNKYYDVEWTLWDRFELASPLTLAELLEHFKQRHRLDVSMLSQNVSVLYSFFMAAGKRRARMSMSMEDIVREVSKREIPPHVRSLVFELVCNDVDGEDVDVPYVKYDL